MVVETQEHLSKDEWVSWYHQYETQVFLKKLSCLRDLEMLMNCNSFESFVETKGKILGISHVFNMIDSLKEGGV